MTLLQFNHSVVSDSFRPHEPQHTRPPCSSPTPRVHPNPCSLSQWCHPTSHPLSSPSPPAFSLSQHQGLFKWVSSSYEVAKVLEFQLQHQSFQYHLGLISFKNGLVGSPCSPGNSQKSAPTPQFKSINSSDSSRCITNLTRNISVCRYRYRYTILMVKCALCHW